MNCSLKNNHISEIGDDKWKIIFSDTVNIFFGENHSGKTKYLDMLKDICEYNGLKEVIFLRNPDAYLSPRSIVLFVKDIKDKYIKCNKQVFIETVNPVTISQFEIESLFDFKIVDGKTLIMPVKEYDIQDLLKEYAIGSLYMSELWDTIK